MAMWHQRENGIRLRKTFLLIAIIALASKANAQVNELTSSGVYDYLYRMAEKGLIKWNDYQLPVDRRSISSAIDSLSSIQNKLSKTESKELEFYKQEYAFDHF